MELRFDAEEILDDSNSINVKEEFTKIINRGGLTKPSDFLYVTAVQASTMLKFVNDNDYLRKSLMESKNPRDLFVAAFMMKLGEKEETEQLFQSTCKVGHNLRKYISRVAFTMFNVRAKNYASEKNDEIHKSQKNDEIHKSQKKEQWHRKVINIGYEDQKFEK